MAYLGSWKIDDYITIPAHTTRFSSGAAYDASSITYRVYEDVTNTEIVADTSMTKFDTETGFYLNQLQLTAASGFEKGKAYTVLIKATVDSVAGTASHTFQIEAEVDANAVSDKTGYALSGTQTFNVTGDITGNLSGSVGSVTGAVGSVTGNVGGNVAGSVGSVTGAVGSVTGSVGSIAAGGINAASIGTGAIDADALAADAVTEIQNGLATSSSITSLDGKIDTIDNFLDTEVAAILADTNELQTDLVNGGRLDLLIDAIKAKTDNIPAAPAAVSDIPTAAANADAVWDEDLSGHTTAGTAGKALSDAGAMGTPLDAAGVRAAIGLAAANLDTQLAAIVGDTGELQTDWVNGGRLDLLIDDLVAKLVCVKAAVYDTASVTGDVITLSNGATQTIGADGDRTTA